MEYYTKRKKAEKSSAETIKIAEKNLYSSAACQTSGAPLKSVDPVFQIAAGFTQQFDALGKQNASKMSKKDELSSEQSREEGKQQPAARSSLREQHDSPEYVHSPAELGGGNFTDRFSEYAFRGGKLAASVMAGQGRQMFTVCLARALGRPMPLGERQKKLLGSSRVEMPVPNMSADVTFNRDVNSAVGIVTDTMRGSTRILDLFRSLVTGSGQRVSDPLELRGVETLRQTLPFLDTDRDRALISEYRSRLRTMGSDSSETAGILRTALAKQSAVLQRKVQQQREFLTVLNRIYFNVEEAEKLFSSGGFAETAAEEAYKLTTDTPPEDGSGNSIAESIAEAVADFFSGLRGENDPGTDENGVGDSESRSGAGEEAGGDPDGSDSS